MNGFEQMGSNLKSRKATLISVYFAALPFISVFSKMTSSNYSSGRMGHIPDNSRIYDSFGECDEKLREFGATKKEMHVA